IISNKRKYPTFDVIWHNEPGPGFENFLDTPCQYWDAKIKERSTEEERRMRYVSKSIQVATHGTTSSHGYGLRLRYYSYPWNYVFAWLWTTSPLLATATHGTTSSHGYGLRLRYSQPVTANFSLDNLDTLIYKLYFCKVESRKTGQIDNFWKNHLSKSKKKNFEQMNAENVTLSISSCEQVQIGGVGNAQVRKRIQPSIEEQIESRKVFIGINNLDAKPITKRNNDEKNPDDKINNIKKSHLIKSNHNDSFDIEISRFKNKPRATICSVF
ncbi:5444_t:CDS:2, partial [Acaulospora morrowiae]